MVTPSHLTSPSLPPHPIISTHPSSPPLSPSGFPRIAHPVSSPPISSAPPPRLPTIVTTANVPARAATRARVTFQCYPSSVSPPFDLGQTTAHAPSAKTVALRAKVHILTARCHLSSAVGDFIADQPTDESSPPASADFVASLRGSLKRRASSTIDLDRAATALEWFADFVTSSSRMPFTPLAHAGDIQAAVYNSETLELFGEYMRTRGSRQRGRAGIPIASDTIDTYVSTVKTLASLGAHHGITLDSANVIMPRASKATRRGQGPPGQRQLKRGLRASHLRQLIALGYDRSSARGVLEWAAALVAWNLVLRGCELGVVPGKPFDPARDASFGAITWRLPCSDSAGQPWLVWDVVPAKDTTARRRSCPMLVQRRSTGARGTDPMCVYDAIVAAWVQRTGQSPPHEGRSLDPSISSLAFFTGRDGGVWDTEDTRDLARRFAVALGLPPSEFGGKSFRIGGATDWRDVFGADAERIITQRGRWHSDIALLYQRALAEPHLRGSAAVADASHADLESMCQGWVQPATFR